MKRIKNNLKQFYKELRREDGYDVFATVVFFCMGILIVLNLLR